MSVPSDELTKVQQCSRTLPKNLLQCFGRALATSFPEGPCKKASRPWCTLRLCVRSMHSAFPYPLFLQGTQESLAKHLAAAPSTFVLCAPRVMLVYQESPYNSSSSIKREGQIIVETLSKWVRNRTVERRLIVDSDTGSAVVQPSKMDTKQ